MVGQHAAEENSKQRGCEDAREYQERVAVELKRRFSWLATATFRRLRWSDFMIWLSESAVSRSQSRTPHQTTSC